MDAFIAKNIKPMLSVRSEPFSSPDFLYEVKWDGIRCLAYLNEECTLRSRNNLDITEGYPELLQMHKWVRERPVILDGEIVVMKNGKPSFNEWQKRSRLKDTKRLQTIAEANPAVYLVFDILYLAGKKLNSVPLLERKEILNRIVEEKPSLALSRFVMETGKEFYTAVAAQELEGVVAKKLDSPYVEGKRTNYWLKFKRATQEDYVICGFLPGTKVGIGSLVLGAYRDNQLEYQGLVGTGISGKDLAYLAEYIKANTIDQYPFKQKIRELRNGIWLKSNLVCAVDYLEKRTGGLRHPTFRGLRFDKEPIECKIEGDLNE